MNTSSGEFQETARTWIDLLLARGEEGHREVMDHVMRVYAEPLTAFARRALWRSNLDPSEVVHAFFETRSRHRDYFVRWGASGMPLRRWLMNGLLLHAKGMRRGRPSADLDEFPEPQSPEPSPERAFEGAFARSILQLALEQTRDECEARGQERHFGVFISHHFEGVSYADLAREAGLEVDAARPMGRVVARRLARAVRGLLVRDGVAPDRIDDEIEGIVRAIGQ